ncbi:MAG: DGQHR domain-containing protein, partial [Flavobacteriales bacterium]|nr:DGQHR domain-containing protein [Flavobacteriales bacterium]
MKNWMSMQKTESLVLPTRRVLQNNQEYLLGVFKIQDVLAFTRYSEYTILSFDEENDNKPETSKEVQRKISPSKVKSISDFLILDKLAMFPTNLVVAIPDHVIVSQTEDPLTGTVNIHLSTKVSREIEKIDRGSKGDVYLTIIDGQHRVAGIQHAFKTLKADIKLNTEFALKAEKPEEFEKKASIARKKLSDLESFELSVSFFVDPVLEFQAMIFSTINRTQTKVSPDLVYSLFGLTKGDSPQKTCLNVINTLNGREISPFYKRVRLAGARSLPGREFYKGGNPNLSQATCVKASLSLICTRKEEENARHRNRDYFLKSVAGLPLRTYYGENADGMILKIIFSFFTAVRRTFLGTDGNSLWDIAESDNKAKSNILQTTIGFMSLIEILRVMVLRIEKPERDKVD